MISLYFFFPCYLGWNAWWVLYLHKIPPSILKYFTGLPAPTTGMARSLSSLLQKNWMDFFLFNPFTLPIIILTCITVIIVFRNFYRKKEIRTPSILNYSWALVLSLAWICKFIIGATYY